ncbi:hypothetical protein LDENG_00130870 [Lucifuga dentata]|nr:hypothetical protein LDENG_00130870 [Lucifuga dentata]
MNFDQIPSKSEVMGWDPHHLADYLKRINLSSCDKVVMKNSMSGSRFVQMSENDLQKFPKLHAPMIFKICSEINKKEERRGLFGKKPTVPKYPEPDLAADVHGWDDDEFDDDDYESPKYSDDEGSVGEYESPTEDQNVASDDYEPPPSEPPEDLTHMLCPTLPMGDSDYIDNRDNHVSSRGPPAVCPRPQAAAVSTLPARLPSPPRRDPSPHFGGRPSAKFVSEPPQIFRCNKPGRDAGSNPSPVPGRHRNSEERPATQPWRPQLDVPEPSSYPKPPAPPSFRHPPNKFDMRKEQTQDEAPRTSTFPLQSKSLPPRPGFLGTIPRHGDSLPPSLPSVGSLPLKPQSARKSFHPPPTPNKTHTQDGAYLVRDSTRQAAGQPFTLMVLYQDKVYNIQIKQKNKQFLLGTGLKVQETFPAVCDIISHYSQSPLLLIDAKNRGSSQQNQCLLSDPAAYWLAGQNWS